MNLNLIKDKIYHIDYKSAFGKNSFRYLFRLDGVRDNKVYTQEYLCEAIFGTEIRKRSEGKTCLITLDDPCLSNLRDATQEEIQFFNQLIGQKGIGDYSDESFPSVIDQYELI